jgi:hypothetical protein
MIDFGETFTGFSTSEGLIIGSWTLDLLLLLLLDLL